MQQDSNSYLPTLIPTRNFGQQLRLLRRRARITQAELGIAVGYSDAQICRLETGRRPPDLTTLVALFFPALQIEPTSEEAHQLLILAAHARSETESTPKPDSVHSRPLHPHPQTKLIGRHAECTLIADRLADPAVRLVTLIGPPGVGKTHLALHTAHDLAFRYAQGVCFIDLSAITDHTLVASAIAHELEISEEGYLNAEVALGAVLAQREMLLVLDNVEQIRSVGVVVKAILAKAPKINLLLTSRVALRLAAEHLIPIWPLPVPNLAALPDLDTLAQVEAMALLLERLRATNPLIDLNQTNALTLAAICVRVDGVPLAIELVAAYGRLFTPQELLTEITHQFLQMRRRYDLPDRHYSLTTALRWSYEQLAPSVQVLFDHLSVFAGSWTIDAVVEVCDLEGVGRLAILDDLQILLDHSLIQCHTSGTLTHYSMLAMMREYARERCLASGKNTNLHDRLVAYCEKLAVNAEQQLGIGSDEALWINRLAVEYDSFRSALHWALNSHLHAQGLRLAGSLWRFWYYRGHLREGRRWLETFLEFDIQDAIEPQAQAFDGAAILAWRQGEYSQAEEWCQQALSRYRMLSHTKGEAQVLSHLGLVASHAGSNERGAGYYEASLPLYQALDDRAGIASVLHNLGNLYCQHNDNQRANELFEECLEHYQALGSQSGVALISLGLAAIARDQGAIDRAASLLNHCLELAQVLGDNWITATTHINLGELGFDSCDFAQSHYHFEQAMTIFQSMGDQQSICVVTERFAVLALRQHHPDEAINLFRQSMLLANGLGFQPGIAAGLEGLAACIAPNQPLLAATLLAGAGEIRINIGFPIPLVEQKYTNAVLQNTQQHTNPKAWQAAWNKGTRLTIPQLVALALSTAFLA